MFDTFETGATVRYEITAGEVLELLADRQGAAADPSVTIPSVRVAAGLTHDLASLLSDKWALNTGEQAAEVLTQLLATVDGVAKALDRISQWVEQNEHDPSLASQLWSLGAGLATETSARAEGLSAQLAALPGRVGEPKSLGEAVDGIEAYLVKLGFTVAQREYDPKPPSGHVYGQVTASLADGRRLDLVYDGGSFTWAAILGEQDIELPMSAWEYHPEHVVEEAFAKLDLPLPARA
ncbi:hypothetical protein PV410_24810 [Streptomyces sp. PA03-5A]|nr:hypothetical protein [Streptomyces sp. PA03-5A]